MKTTNFLFMLVVMLLFTNGLFAQSTSLRITNNTDYRLWIRAVAIDPTCSSNIGTTVYVVDGSGCTLPNVVNIAPVASSTYTWEIVEILNIPPTSSCLAMLPNFDSHTLISNPYNSCPDFFPANWTVLVNCNILCTSLPCCPLTPNMNSAFISGQDVHIN